MSLESDIKRFTEGPLRCDFCNVIMDASDASRTFNAMAAARGTKLFATMPSGLEVLDSGEWLACGECYELIDKQDWQAFEARAIAGALSESPVPLDMQDVIARIKTIILYVFGV